MTSMIGKKLILGISGGIAAYKCCDLVRSLTKMGAEIHVVMTRAAEQFVTPLSLQTLSKHRVHRDMFELSEEMNVEHISLADMVDVLLVVPATANIISKVANGICDDLLTTVIAATKAPVVFAPSMNVNMWENQILQQNITKLRDLHYRFIEPDTGELACGYEGKGRLADIETIIEAATELLRCLSTTHSSQ